ncbi:MAG: hypothetical protein A3D65_03835 [Candidatus Lloydbacteria bacterium RIFCSPHIGHO2_02_FULL_50_13]|uniref:Uncharacterized protein n=1 Tax=Candidatus Lloydbacteria bacterium RIFCSPHIGHO2_02_FULL_50_13 TaxID=1798661 RepID=A0A1G2D1W2_9BACT|nr:MAG: hypothetical protein A3D65_03835 [Candidatus Lloydbacteria bacterium RIFCSPHIGHO2_02_FULL_50_13]
MTDNQEFLKNLTNEEKQDLDEVMSQPGSPESFATGNEVATEDLAQGMGENEPPTRTGTIVSGNDTVH